MKGYDSCSLLLEENLYKTFTTRINIHQVLLMQTCRQGLNAGRIRHLRRQRHCRIATQKQDPAPVLWGHHPAPMPTTGSPLSAPKGKCYPAQGPIPTCEATETSGRASGNAGCRSTGALLVTWTGTSSPLSQPGPRRAPLYKIPIYEHYTVLWRSSTSTLQHSTHENLNEKKKIIKKMELRREYSEVGEYAVVYEGSLRKAAAVESPAVVEEMETV